ncbi:TSC22 domain family protein 1-like isoform X2 [Poecilia formosa]|uniref:TSC22 domain family protein 1-like isoform X2 n=1 Tax=Poecilia formosa TaxID=48698 RepID=UPI0007B8022C|nr:PREDICTED: TSC22 domain family protein 1-like isoform X2 [Poecilia formosa]
MLPLDSVLFTVQCAGFLLGGFCAFNFFSLFLHLLVWTFPGLELSVGQAGGSLLFLTHSPTLLQCCQDLVKSHLMYAVREEVEVLKEQIKELMERNTQLEQENNLLKTLASPEQMAQFQAQVQTGGSPTGAAQALPPSGPTQVLSSAQNSGTSG